MKELQDVMRINIKYLNNMSNLATEKELPSNCLVIFLILFDHSPTL